MPWTTHCSSRGELVRVHRRLSGYIRGFFFAEDSLSARRRDDTAIGGGESPSVRDSLAGPTRVRNRCEEDERLLALKDGRRYIATPRES